MIQRLLEYPASSDINIEPGFAPKHAKWAIQLDSDGTYIGIARIGQEGKGGGRGLLFPKVPHLTLSELKRNGAGTRHFLLDTIEIVALLGKEEGSPTLKLKHAFFWGLMEQAAGQLRCLDLITRSISDPEVFNSLRRDLTKQKSSVKDNITFMIGDEYLVNFQECRSWWRRWLASSFAKNNVDASQTAHVRCLATGELVLPSTTHEKIFGLSSIGGLTTGDVLVGFNQRSFCSYGFTQSENAAISRNAAKAYQASLNDVIELGQTFGKVRVAHWYKKPVLEKDDPWKILLEGSFSRVDPSKLASSLNRGIKQRTLEDTSLYAVTLSGASGRVMIRDWSECTLVNVAKNVAMWFSDLALVYPQRDKIVNPKFRDILGSISRRPEDLSPSLVALLWHAALHDTEIPGQIHVAALNYVRWALSNQQFPNVIAVALLKAFHSRRNQRGPTSTNDAPHPLRAELDMDQPQAAYHLGRVSALLSKIQEVTLQDTLIESEKRSRMLKAFIPPYGYDLLLKRARTLREKWKYDRSIFRSYESMLSESLSRIHPPPSDRLSIGDQSLFVIGYYHQLVSMWKVKKK